MTLKEYIESLGPTPAEGAAEFVRRHGISERSTAHYRWGTRKPSPDVARKLVAESPLTWEDIYPPKADTP